MASSRGVLALLIRPLLIASYGLCFESADDDHASAHGVVPWAQPWGTVGEPPPPDRKLLMAQHRLKVLRMAHLGSSERWWAQPAAVAEILHQLATNSFAFLDGFQGGGAAEQLRAQVVELHRAGLLGGGRVRGLGRETTRSSGAALTRRFDEQIYGAGDAGGGAAAAAAVHGGVSAGFIRGDEIAWMNVPQRQQFSEPDADPLSRYTWLLDEFVTLLSAADDGSKGGLKGVQRRSETMVTCYPHGARYMRHTDNSCKNGTGRRCNGRRLTVIGYLNPPRADGNGAVRLFASGDALTSPPRIDIQPDLDRVLLFYSDERTPHEVLPSTDWPRYAVTVWFYDLDEAPAPRHNLTRIAAQADTDRSGSRALKSDDSAVRHTSRWWFMGGGVWNKDLPWLNKSFTRQAVELVSVHRSAMTGVYMFLPLSVQQLGSANVASVVANDELISSIVPQFTELGLTVSLAIWVDPRLMETGAAVAAVPNLTAAAVKHNLTGIFIDYEVGNMGGEWMASNYSVFLTALSESMHGV